VLRAHADLDEATERCVTEAIDVGFSVHREIGPGYMELPYRNAMRVELSARNIPFVSEKTFEIAYRGHIVGVHRLDFVVRGCVLVELKAIRNFDPAHMAQVMAYLKASQLRVGLLMNFACAAFKEGLRRIVL
jgi:GxxExxY protein